MLLFELEMLLTDPSGSSFCWKDTADSRLLIRRMGLKVAPGCTKAKVENTDQFDIVCGSGLYIYFAD